ncbi:MAG: DUF192 domain-containing protein [Myxococcales bacterium]|nr:DUF192 domain-containing protein [Myxococcales bacterium]
MKLVNRRNAAVLAESVERATTVFARLRGLLGRDSLSGALVIEPCTSIHTFFMKFAIDAAFLTAEGRVIRAISAIRPWRATRIYLSAAKVVELPAGTLERTRTTEGDVLAFEL